MPMDALLMAARTKLHAEVGAVEADDGRAGERGGRADQPEGAQHVAGVVCRPPPRLDV